MSFLICQSISSANQCIESCFLLVSCGTLAEGPKNDQNNGPCSQQPGFEFQSTMVDDMAVNRRRVRTSARQFELVLDFMETHPNLASSRLGSTFTIKDRRREWNEFADFLNSHQLGAYKDSDKWRKVWNDFKSATKQKALKIASGKGTVENLTPIEERLLRILDWNPSIKQEPFIKSESASDSIYEADEQFSSEWHRSQSQDSNGVSPPGDASFGENHEEYIVPTPDGPLSADLTDRIIVLSDVRSLSSPSRIKEEPVNADDEVVSVEFAPQPAVQNSPPTGSAVTEDASRRRDPRPTASNVERRQPPSTSAVCLLEKKMKLEVDVLLATKRKMEAEERRADAEAEFFHEEKRRASSLVALHEEEQRKVVAMAEFHREEKRKAHAKAELLMEHKRFFVAQQRTEVVRRKLLLLELRKLRQDMTATVNDVCHK
ncbi:uncharacterized protein LOC135388115 isoform X1 [Ornithodoros turicata]|uniref:uncharacterized protein LOC135388115 isoform X1 n=1 Tax=Ornithodoros turicata TaxID=34597 RepID=UPI00313A1185